MLDFADHVGDHLARLLSQSGNTWLRAFLANYFRNPARPMSINELPDYTYGDNFLIYYEQLTGKPAAAISDDEAIRLRPLIHRRSHGAPHQSPMDPSSCKAES